MPCPPPCRGSAEGEIEERVSGAPRRDIRPHIVHTLCIHSRHHKLSFDLLIGSKGHVLKKFVQRVHRRRCHAMGHTPPCAAAWPDPLRPNHLNWFVPPSAAGAPRDAQRRTTDVASRTMARRSTVVRRPRDTGPPKRIPAGRQEAGNGMVRFRAPSFVALSAR